MSVIFTAFVFNFVQGFEEPSISLNSMKNGAATLLALTYGVSFLRNDVCCLHALHSTNAWRGVA